MHPAQVESWFLAYGRDLPWRKNRDPYRIWLSEIMLQQTQVAVVIDYFERFTARFPTLKDLALAHEDEVLALWSGLGYYSRGRNLHKAAKILYEQWDAQWPKSAKDLQALPGVGSYTAGAIASMAFGDKAPVVDGNIARVLSRLFNDTTPIDTPQGKKHFEALSHSLVQKAHNPGHFQEGMIELGALICKKSAPRCELCPVQTSCGAFKADSIANLPQRSPKRARTALHVACAIGLDDNGAVLLEKGASKGLFGGLYAPPHVTVSTPKEASVQLAALLKSRALKVPSTIPDPVIVRRTLTHRDLVLYGFILTQSSALQHFKSKDFPRIGLSKAMSVLLERCLGL